MKNNKTIIIFIVTAILLAFFSLSGMMSTGGYGMMGGFGSGFNFMWIFGWLFMTLIILALILFIAWLIKEIQKEK